MEVCWCPVGGVPGELWVEAAWFDVFNAASVRVVAGEVVVDGLFADVAGSAVGAAVVDYAAACGLSFWSGPGLHHCVVSCRPCRGTGAGVSAWRAGPAYGVPPVWRVGGGALCPGAGGDTCRAVF